VAYEGQKNMSHGITGLERVKRLIRPTEIHLDITKQNFVVVLEDFQNFLSLLVKIKVGF
jgi:hypothetical protein